MRMNSNRTTLNGRDFINIVQIGDGQRFLTQHRGLFLKLYAIKTYFKLYTLLNFFFRIIILVVNLLNIFTTTKKLNKKNKISNFFQP